VCNLLTKKHITGQFIVKTDVRSCCLAIKWESIDFREERIDLGVHITPDQLHADLNSRCKKSTIHAASVKMRARVEAQKKAQNNRGYSSDTNIDAVNDPVTHLCDTVHDMIANDDGIEADIDEDDDKNQEEFIFDAGLSVCVVSVDNIDLAHIVDGFVGDPLKDQPLDY
jgi:hypothetical protein